MPFSDIFVEALTKVSASRKAYLRHLYIKPACYEENALVSASEVFASKSDDRRKIIPGSLRIVFRIPVPPVEIPEATASERPAPRLIHRIASASSRSNPPVIPAAHLFKHTVSFPIADGSSEKQSTRTTYQTHLNLRL